MTIETGSRVRESLINKKYSNILQTSTLKKCEDYSNLYFESTAGGLFKTKHEKDELKTKIKEEAKNIANLEENAKIDLLRYLEELILNQGNYEFIIPYHFVSKDLNMELNDYIVKQEDIFHLGVLGTVHEFLGE